MPITLASTVSAATYQIVTSWMSNCTGSTDTAIGDWQTGYSYMWPTTSGTAITLQEPSRRPMLSQERLAAAERELRRAYAEEQAIATRNYEQANRTWTTQWIEYTYTPNTPPVVFAPLTPEQQELQAAAAQARIDAAHARQAKLAHADKRAERLLLMMLSKEQRESYEKKRYFDVIAGQSKRRYRLHHGSHGNVKLMDGEREVISYCAQPDNVPLGDSMLAQKLQIECDESAFLKVANGTDIATGRRVPRTA